MIWVCHIAKHYTFISPSLAMKILLNIGGGILLVHYKNVKHVKLAECPFSTHYDSFPFQWATREGPEASKTLIFMHTTDQHVSFIHYSTYMLSYCKYLNMWLVAEGSNAHRKVLHDEQIHVVITQKLKYKHLKVTPRRRGFFQKKVLLPFYWHKHLQTLEETDRFGSTSIKLII